MPLQHVDDGVLKAMRRGHGETPGARAGRASSAQRIPGVTLRTTFIVGHPGETEEEFQRLCDFVREAEFDRVGVFTYSREEGTRRRAAARDRVPAQGDRRRRRELMRIQREISKKKLQRDVGRELEVLVEGPRDESEYLLMGRHEGQAPEIDGQVYLSLGADGATPAAGSFVQAQVTHSAEYDLAAEIVRARATRLLQSFFL